VLIRLGEGDTAPNLWQNHHMSPADARQALQIVTANRDRLLAEWRKLHG
jgi:hypothetical protein